MKLWYTFLRDMKVSYRTFYVYIEIFMALVFVAVMLFVIPENFETTRTMAAYVDPSLNPAQVEEAFLQSGGEDILLLPSREALIEMMEEDRSASGAVISLRGGRLHYEILLQGYEGERLRNIIETAFAGGMQAQHPAFEDRTEMEVLHPGAQRLSDRVAMLPVYLMLNSSFMGLFIVAAYVFMDKDEGTIRALTVTPVTIRDYLLSKVGVMLFTGLLTGVLVVAFIAGTQTNYPLFLLVLATTNLFGTALGLFIASFYDTLIKSMGTIMMVVIAMAFASISYYMPSFSPLVLRLLPSYPMLFAFRETFLSSPNTGYVVTVSLGFLLAGVLIFLWAHHRYRRTLTV